MTRFAIDAAAALRLVAAGFTVPDGQQLVAPNLLRSQAMGLLYRDVRAGTLDPARAERLLDGVTTLRVRLLGDRVSRAVAWRIAAEQGWDDVAPAEYVAVARLQADVLVAVDEDLARRARGLVDLAPVEDLLALGAS
ncbi:type II toxin-antitoxin system VapC family toxin [Cellulomonas sp. IC4_254]|uniref:type II toxin-antitoxin system VapC family toxin n=1 Tax=Cellulomonas sp. IC4_254 TaxID=2714040 RepID=UPI00141F86D3|nr:type II toxin-antitoxin system VapC family toxin [Cellulomonas sp. IC4_254]NHT17858.1 type II toxin-antitoxin system VapC family toxin [Cellulomonas sp. IC4_254]